VDQFLKSEEKPQKCINPGEKYQKSDENPGSIGILQEIRGKTVIRGKFAEILEQHKKSGGIKIRIQAKNKTRGISINSYI
jgi:hypothetical protein